MARTMSSPEITPEMLRLGLIWYVVFLFSTVCHEGAHALVAMLGGDLTAFHGGQVSLNPVPHIRRAPFGLVVVPILSYALGGWMIGWASAPYDPYWQQRYPRRAAWMALAGPAANLILMLLAAIAIRAGVAAGWLRAPQSIGIGSVAALADGTTNLGTTFLSIVFTLNLLLATFNLMPVPPLDGNVGVTVLMKESAALRFISWSREGQYGLIGLLLAWYAFGYIFQPIFFFALRLLYPGVVYQ
ncbi:MAG TPA: site-2 protease family protein [Candidatus Acidoferrales bacterium]|nr:site-2 protease family protein [Candidatus Acidoferrales bacterium]